MVKYGINSISINIQTQQNEHRISKIKDFDNREEKTTCSWECENVNEYGKCATPYLLP